LHPLYDLLPDRASFLGTASIIVVNANRRGLARLESEIHIQYSEEAAQ